jgi:hypothetical protein
MYEPLGMGYVVQLVTVPTALKGTKLTAPAELVTEIVDLNPEKAMVAVEQRSNDARLIRFAELLLIVVQSVNAVPLV